MTRLGSAFRVTMLVGLVEAVAGQASVQPNDFARGLKIDAPTGQAFFRIDLPARVYSETAWPDLRDLAVFNGSGEPVSFARITSPTRTARTTFELQSFRLESTTTSGTREIEVDSREHSVQLRVAPIATVTGAEYLLASTDHESGVVERLVLDWFDRDANWQQTVTVAVSHDLASWRTVANARPILDLQTDSGQRLKHREVSVDAVNLQADRYWRLTFGPGDPPRLTSVEAVMTEAAAQPRFYLPTLLQAQTSGSAVYELPRPQPVGRLRIVPQDDNTVLPILIEGRDAADSNWRPLNRTTAYSILTDQGRQASDPVDVGGRTLRSVRLTPIGASWGPRAPVVEIERDPVTIVANARGTGPFLLAWGNRAALETSVPLSTLIPDAAVASVFDITEGRPGAEVTLGGPSRLTETSPAERKALWQSTLVWLMLIGGAGALALLALRLWRDVAHSER